MPRGEYLPLVATGPEGLSHYGHPALGSATPPMSSEGEGVTLGSPGPLRGSHQLHSPVMGLVWDRQGPGDQGTEEGSWTLRWGQRYRKGKPGCKGSETGFGSCLGVDGTWMEEASESREVETASATLTSPGPWGLLRPCPLAGPSSSGCRRPGSHGLASGREESMSQGCSSPGVIF